MKRKWGRNKPLPITNKEIIQEYEKGISQSKVAEKFGINRRTVYLRMQEENYKTRPQKMETHSCWKGGKQTLNGYPCFREPTHPRAKTNGYVYYHQIIAEKMVGKKLGKNNPVHHIDFDKMNYSENNLFVCNGEKEHRNIHVSLETIARELFHRGYVKFENGKYIINEKRLA